MFDSNNDITKEIDVGTVAVVECVTGLVIDYISNSIGSLLSYTHTLMMITIIAHSPYFFHKLSL